MSTAIEHPPKVDPADTESTETRINRPLQQFVLDGVTYEQFMTLTDVFGERHLRVSYDGDQFEIMSPSRKHERGKTLIGRLIEQLTLELDIPLESGGSTTFRNEFVHRGLEPDECYWIQRAAEIRGVEDWQAGEHPPPDLAIEIDVTTSSVNRQDIYAKLRVPELWRFDGESLRALHLNESGEYVPAERSVAFPFLTVAHLAPFITRKPPTSETDTVREFVDWLRQQNFEPRR